MMFIKKKKTFCKKITNGFLLVEVMIAVLILSCSIGIGARSLWSIIQQHQKAKRYFKATTLASSLAQEILAHGALPEQETIRADGFIVSWYLKPIDSNVLCMPAGYGCQSLKNFQFLYINVVWGQAGSDNNRLSFVTAVSCSKSTKRFTPKFFMQG